MFQSKLFRKIFLPYILIVISYMILCVSFLVFQNSQIVRIQNEYRNEMKLEEASRVFERRMEIVRGVQQNLRYSETMKQLYLHVRLNEPMDSSMAASIQGEMKSVMYQNGLSIYTTVLFLDGNDRAYSSGNVIVLAEPYERDSSVPTVANGSINEVLSLQNEGRYSFNREGIVYTADYTWQNGLPIGTLCILLDGKELERDLEGILGEDSGLTILYNGEILYGVGSEDGQVYQLDSEELSGLSYCYYAGESIGAEVQQYFYLMFAGILVISVLFVILAYVQSRRYYIPIDQMGRLIETNDASDSDEMEDIIHGIEDLIGEKNRYREKMLTITPYVQTGILHSMITGNAQSDNIGVMLDETYLDLVKPYYIVSIVNFHYDDQILSVRENHRQKIESLFKRVVSIFSTEETHLVYYFRDVYNVFLICSFDLEEPTEELLMRIHQFLRTETESVNAQVTIGVDERRDDIQQLREACSRAVQALDGILTDGRDAVYFAGDEPGEVNEYYFPTDFSERLKQCLKGQNRQGIHELLYEVYSVNLNRSGSPQMYRSLVDEVHSQIISVLHEILGLNTMHVRIEKFTELATLQDIFDYYDAALMSVIDSMQERKDQAKEDKQLRKEIVAYINRNLCNPNLSQQEIMDTFNVSSKFLSLLCRDCFGQTYLQYVQNERIEIAKQLLMEGKYSLTEISERCGYVNQLTFRRNFKRVTGVNPSDYAGSGNSKR